jgi:hypothetical protein
MEGASQVGMSPTGVKNRDKSFFFACVWVSLSGKKRSLSGWIL